MVCWVCRSRCVEGIQLRALRVQHPDDLLSAADGNGKLGTGVRCPGDLDVAGVAVHVTDQQGPAVGGDPPADALRADLQAELVGLRLDDLQRGGAQHQVVPFHQEDADGKIVEGGADEGGRLQEQLIQRQERRRPAADLRDQLLPVRPLAQVGGELPQRVEQVTAHDAPAEDGDRHRIGDRHQGKAYLRQGPQGEAGDRGTQAGNHEQPQDIPSADQDEHQGHHDAHAGDEATA